MSTLYSPCCSQIASTSGAVTSREALLCWWSNSGIGNTKTSLGKRAGREISSLSMSLMSVLPVRAGRSCCLIASSIDQVAVDIVVRHLRFAR